MDIIELPHPIPSFILRFLEDDDLQACRLVAKTWVSYIDASFDLWKLKCYDCGIDTKNMKACISVTDFKSIYFSVCFGIKKGMDKSFTVTRQAWPLLRRSMLYLEPALVYEVNTSVVVIINLSLSVVRFIQHVEENDGALIARPKFCLIPNYRTIAIATSYAAFCRIKIYSLHEPVTNTSVYMLDHSITLENLNLYDLAALPNKCCMCILVGNTQVNNTLLKILSYPTGECIQDILLCSEVDIFPSDNMFQNAEVHEKDLLFESSFKIVEVKRECFQIVCLIYYTLFVFDANGILLYKSLNVIGSPANTRTTVTSFVISEHKESVSFVEHVNGAIYLNKIDLRSYCKTEEICLFKNDNWHIHNVKDELSCAVKCLIFLKAIGNRFGIIGIRSETSFNIYLLNLDHKHCTKLTDIHASGFSPLSLDCFIFRKQLMLNGLTRSGISGTWYITGHKQRENMDFNLHPGEHVQRSELHFGYWPGSVPHQISEHFDTFHVQGSV